MWEWERESELYTMDDCVCVFVAHKLLLILRRIRKWVKYGKIVGEVEE